VAAQAFDGAAGGTGSRLGKYELVRRLAVGGMAEIFLARVKAAHGFEKLVVVKRILPQYAEDEDFVRMLLDEARLAATLHHPNVVQVYDMGVDEETGQSFFSMEWVHGQDLRRIVRACLDAQKWLPLEHVLAIATGVAAGLHHAHEQTGLDGRPLEIVHRDVSPSNVLVTYTGSVKLVDFGIAKATSAQTTTRHGTLKGKIPYMSPEQCRGERLDRRSDVFSLGTVLWELSTGHRLWKADNELATLSRIANEDPPPPSSRRADYPPELEAIVMRALRRDRDERYQTAQELQLDLEEFAREHKLPVSSAYLGRFMQELFADEIARTMAAARADPDASIQTLLTADLEFLAPRLLEAEGARTAAIAREEPEPSESIVLGLSPGGRRRRTALAALGGAAAAAVLGGLAYWIAADTPAPGDPAPAMATVPPPTPAPVPAPEAAPAAAPAPAPAPSPTPTAQAEPTPTPAATRPTARKKPTKKKKQLWDRDSPFLPP
jgi:serine/threonine-protein kinase